MSQGSAFSKPDLECDEINDVDSRAINYAFLAWHTFTASVSRVQASNDARTKELGDWKTGICSQLLPSS